MAGSPEKGTEKLRLCVKLQRHTHKQAYPATGIGKTCGTCRRTPHQNPCAEAFPRLPAHQHGRESPVDQRAPGARKNTDNPGNLWSSVS